MLPQDAPALISLDALRERELSRIAPQLFTTTPLPQQSWTPDPALLAFAQLAACRLDVQRCLISFFDRGRQIVVAESTRSSQLIPGLHEQHARNSDDIWLGGTAIPRSEGPCEHVLVSADRDETQQLHVSVVPDLALDSRYCGCSGICDAPHNRFYAGLALRSATGINIGVLCVFDPEPRPHGLTEKQLEILRSLSHIVTSYLEFSESFRAFRRSECMVRGLESFVTGKETAFDVEPDANRKRAQSQASPPLNIAQPWQPDSVDFDVRDEPALQEVSAVQSHRPALTPVQPAIPSLVDPVDSSNFTAPSLGSARTISAAATLDTSPPKHIKRTMERAARIIRESLEVAGVVFLDAGVRSYGALVPETEDDQRSAFPNQAPGTLAESVTSSIQDEGPMCDVLGSSPLVTTASNCAESATSVPENSLRELLKTFPLGQVFDFNQRKDVSTVGNASTISGSPIQELDTSHGLKVISAMFPEATSVAFVPLWDTKRERWFAASFIWTKVPARSFTTQGEISYLRAFATTIMAEVDRVNTTDSESAKSRLLGSLSHELRSPLHGIVAAVELLHDTELDAFQGDLLQTMDACGRTLLDVIDHLLDYSKINRLIRSTGDRGEKNMGEARPGGRDRYNSFKSQLNSLSYAIDLDALLEETVESMFTMQIGQPVAARSDIHKNMDDGASEAFMPHSLDTATKSVRHSNVSIYLDIDPTISWSGRVEAGAVRRIVMNLLGNSLKFTDHGFIRVSMKREVDNVRKSQARITLTVSDSGRGMSHEFLQHHAFEPFRQEDPLSQGTGMGLSLVSQIVQTLGGSVRIESEPYRGTSATVSIPFKPSGVLDKPNTQFQRNVTALTGSRVALCGFQDTRETLGISTSTAPVEAQIMENLCRGWLHLESVPYGFKEIHPDIVVCTENAMIDVVLATDHKSPPVVVICHNALVARGLWVKSREDQKLSNFEFISEPIGPRKLANAMILAVGRYNEAKAADLVSIEIDTHAVPESKNAASAYTPASTPGVQSSLMCSWLPAQNPVISTPTVETIGITGSGDAEAIGSAVDTSAIKIEPSPPPVNGMAALRVHQPRDQILLVDDNKINLQILVSFMKKLKRPYQTATNGLEALQAFSANPTCFSHVLMDISMPVMDGLESTRGIRSVEAIRGQQQQNEKLSPVNVIALTGLVSADAQQDAFASGVDLYMTKPVKFKELSAVLKEGGGVGGDDEKR